MQILVRDRAFYKKLLSIAVPIALQQLITVGVNMMDTIMLGRLDEVALSASALANQFITLFQIICMGMGMGASVLTARYFAMKDSGGLKRSVSIMLRFCLVLSLIFTALVVFVPRGIMRVYTNNAVLVGQGEIYFRWSIPTFVLMGFSLTLTVVLRSVGKAKLPMFTALIAFFINVFFNYMFIFGRFGAPRMGIAGAALGTVIARAFEFAVILGYFFFRDKAIGYRPRDLTIPCRDLVRTYFAISLPVLISDGLLSLGNSAVAIITGHIGASFVAANSITTVTQQLLTVFVQGTSNASAIMIGHTLGEGKTEEAQTQGYTLFGIGLGIGIAAGLVILSIKNLVIGAYKVGPETAAIASQLMNAIAFIIFFQSGNSILTKGVLRGGGDTKFLMLGDILFLWVASIPLGALAGLVLHWSPFLIYVCLKIDQILKCIWCVWRLYSRKWIKKIASTQELSN